MNQAISKTNGKTCPKCGQGKIPFKLGVCICGKQVGEIRYVKDPRQFANCNYSF